jgi:hypothetical protein
LIVTYGTYHANTSHTSKHHTLSYHMHRCTRDLNHDKRRDGGDLQLSSSVLN